MKKTIILMLLLWPIGLLAQSENVDSLMNVLNTQKLSEEEQVVIYRKLCNTYKNSDPEKLSYYAKRMLEISLKDSNKKDVGKSYFFIGSAYQTKEIPDSALIFYKKALDVALEITDSHMEITIYISMGAIISEQGDQLGGLEYFQKALTIAEETNNIAQLIRILGNIGTLYDRMDHTSQAIYYYEKSKTLAEEANQPDGKCIAYYNLCNIYRQQGEMDKALEYGFKMLEISRSIGFKQYEIVGLLTIAQTYYSDKFKEYDKAEKYATEGLETATEYGAPFLILNSHAILSDTYRKQKDYKRSDIAASKAWELDTTNYATGRDIVANIIYSNIHLNNKDKATQYLEKLIELCRKVNDESIHNAIANMEVKYETEKKETRITVLKKERKLYIWLGILTAIALFMTIVLLFYRHRLSIQNRKIADQQIRQLKQEKELIAIQSSLKAEKAERDLIAHDLHDSVSSLLTVAKNNMSLYSASEHKDLNYYNNAFEVLSKSITELRRVVYHLKSFILTKEGLVAALDDFCRFIPNAEFHFKGLNRRFDPDKEYVLYDCACELINNALKHSGATRIDVHLNIDEQIVYLSIADNGTGFDTQEIMPGIGLENIRSNLSAFGGHLEILSEPDKGTEANVELQV